MRTSFLDIIAADSGLSDNDVLWRIVAKVDEIDNSLEPLAVVFSSRELDAACSDIGARLCPPAPGGEFADHSVYLVTGLAPSGGHTRVLRDFLVNDPAKAKTIIISQVLSTSNIPGFEPLFSGLDVEILLAPFSSDLVGKLGLIQQRLIEIRPATVTMLIHGYDAVSIAAVQPHLMGDLRYVHNVDHSLALGLHLPHARHIDFHAKGFWHCKDVEGVPDPHLVPLIAADCGHRLDRPFLVRGHVTTASCGGFEKFALQRFGSSVQYRYRYAEGVPAILTATQGTHIHYGRLPPDLLQEIWDTLQTLGISRERFIVHDHVPSLWTAMLDEGVDTYVGSFPLGGGRSKVEAMGAGLPLIIHSNYWSIFFSDECEVYSGAMIWRTYDDLRAHLVSLTPETLLEHARRARRYYEQHHRPDRLGPALERARCGGAPPPERPVHRPNQLARFLDFHPRLDT